ncbi:MAG: hypothetical protein AB1673_00930 [Actinomycetota bacterium]|jgi:hypothetical protein
MSTIWTPSGERPVRREPDPQPAAPAEGAGLPGAGGDRQPTEEELAAHFAEVQRQLLGTPASVVIANHVIGLFQLAVLHLEQPQPRLTEAKLAIDAMGAVVETLGPRLGEEEAPMREALAQLRLAYVQRQPVPPEPPVS